MGLTLIKAAICWLFPRQAEPRGAADATNINCSGNEIYQALNTRAFPPVEFVCPDSEPQSLAGITLDARDGPPPSYFS